MNDIEVFMFVTASLATNLKNSGNEWSSYYQGSTIISSQAIADFLNERGVTTQRGKKFTAARWRMVKKSVLDTCDRDMLRTLKSLVGYDWSGIIGPSKMTYHHPTETEPQNEVRNCLSCGDRLEEWQSTYCCTECRVDYHRTMNETYDGRMYQSVGKNPYRETRELLS
jgi:hypothetical protein